VVLLWTRALSVFLLTLHSFAPQALSLGLGVHSARPKSQTLNPRASCVCACVYVRMSILWSIAQEKRNQWVIDNNLAHLLEYTPRLKILHVPWSIWTESGLASTPPPIARPSPRAMLP
jgi:hypothetical protein